VPSTWRLPTFIFFPLSAHGIRPPYPLRESDHAPILISLRPPSPHNDKPRPRWQEVDWPRLTDKLKGWQVPPPPDTPSPNQLDQWFSSALSTLTTTIEATVPHSCPSPRSKAWWTPLLTSLRKEFTKATRRAKKLQTPNSYTIAKQSKLGYFKSLLLGCFSRKDLPEQHLEGQTTGRPEKDP